MTAFRHVLTPSNVVVTLVMLVLLVEHAQTGASVTVPARGLLTVLTLMGSAALTTTAIDHASNPRAARLWKALHVALSSAILVAFILWSDA